MPYNKLITYLVFSLTSLVASVNIHAEIVNDFSRLNPIDAALVIKVNSVQDIINSVITAKNNNLKISIAGNRNSQGGHTASSNGIILSMSQFDKVVELDIESRTITVESGITWAGVQSAINVHGMAIKVSQSSTIFTIGGSLSANIHGRDPRFGPIIETVESFKIVLSDGRHVLASRDENSDLFYAAIGGYGLLGVITEVRLSLTDNYLLEKNVVQLSYDEYIGYLENSLTDKSLELHYGRCSIVRDESFFHECVAVNYISTGSVSTMPLITEKNISRDKYFFGLSRKSDIGKSIRWELQGKLIDSPSKRVSITRNNAMRPPITFVDYYSEKDTDFLQEYFIPIENFSNYLNEMRNIFVLNDVNVLSMTLRYVPKSREAVLLDYAESDAIAVVLYMNTGLSDSALKSTKAWTQQLVDLTHHYHGKYYLTYQGYPSKDQFQLAYPNWCRFKKIKLKYDPEELFTSMFYQQYFQ